MKLHRTIGIISFLVLFTIVFNAPVIAEEYHVLAIRVDFPVEEPDEESTTGRGTFDLADYYTDEEVHDRYANPWDIPPHDRSYFAHHLEALHNYWSTVSDGRITITGHVLPESQNDAYTLSKEFYKYGNGRSEEETNTKLVELVHEAVETCKQIEGDSIDFSAYDTIIIFHAGGARETYSGLNDIPSAYVTPEDFTTYTDNPLVVDGKVIEKAIILPEYASNTGRAGLNGIMAQMFGFRLGLPSFSNNADGLPAAGTWCLMDTGGMAWGYQTIGYIPVHPSAWSKIELGFFEPVTVTTDTTLDIAATHIANGTPRAVKIPISSSEYLLLENRYQYASRDSLADGITFSDNDSAGVWLSADHYDSYIPGSGILIWRVNEQIIAKKRFENTINDDPYRRGFDLLEADGQQDIGALFGFGDSRAEYGVGHEDDTYKSGGVTVCSPRTNPDTGSMWGGESGVTITVNSEPGEIMNVSISFAGRLKGFPVQVGLQEHVTADDLDGDGIDEFMVSGGDSILTVSHNGKTFVCESEAIIRSVSHPLSIFNTKTSKNNLYLLGPYSDRYFEYTNEECDLYALSNWDSFSAAIELDSHIVRSDLNNLIYIQRIAEYHTNITIRNSMIFSHTNGIAIQDTSHFHSIASAEQYVAALGKGETFVLYLGNSDDEELVPYTIAADTVLGPILVDLDRDDSYEAIVTADQWLQVYDHEGNIESASLSGTPVGSPVAADIDGDGFPEVIQCTERHVFAYGANAVLAPGFPYSLPPGDGNEVITSPPVVADLDGDNSLDIACVTSNGRLLAFDTSGQMADGFPTTVTGQVTSSPCVFKLSASGDTGIAYLTNDGYLMAHDLGTAINDDSLAPWPMWKAGPGLAGSLLNASLKQEPDDTAEFEAFCYPNPVTGDTGTFRILPEGPTDIKVTLYTVDGQKLFNAHLDESEVLPGLANEIRFPADDLASGLYLARIETKQETVIYKVGVLK